jgi:ATP-dependent Lon protease
MEFAVMLAQLKKPEDEIDLHVVTWNTPDFTADSVRNFEEITSSLEELGVHLTYEFQDLHDRHILSENGWKIILGRGLDIYEPRESRFDVAELYPEKRKCKNFEVTYLRF